jgi:hypothetical protein
LYTRNERDGPKEVEYAETAKKQGNKQKDQRRIQEAVGENREGGGEKEGNVEENWKRIENYRVAEEIERKK